MKITLDGIYDTVLSGFQCMRGYAPLKDLAALSAPNPAFQRNLIDTHRAEIERFMNDGQYLFFPEVILACPLRYEFDSNSESGMNPMRMIQDKEAFTSNVNDLQIKFRSDDKEKLQRVSLTLDSEVDSGFLLSRIDGNHRISALDINPDTYGKMRVPFCVIFLQDGDDRVEKVIFNNINFKQIPLRPEHSLKVILDTFSDSELQEERFGWPYWYTKKLLECIETGFFLNTSFLIKDGDNHHDECRTTLFKLCEFLEQDSILPKEEGGFDSLRKAVQKVDISLEGHKVSQGLFIAAVRLILIDSDRFPEFIRWVNANSLDDISEIAPKTLIDIFYKVFEKRKKQIFISMPFGNDNTEDHYKHIVNAIEEINKEHNLSIAIKSVRIDKTDKPATFQITDEILEFIDNSGVLIADLSYANPNVYHEVGYAMALAKERKLENNVILILKEGLPENDSAVKFNLTGFSQLRFKQTSELQQEIKKRIVSFYGLSSNKKQKAA